MMVESWNLVLSKLESADDNSLAEIFPEWLESTASKIAFNSSSSCFEETFCFCSVVFCLVGLDVPWLEVDTLVIKGGGFLCTTECDSDRDVTYGS